MAHTLAVGHQIVVTKGQYSDYQSIAFCVVTKELSLTSIKSNYLVVHKEQQCNYGFDDEMFLAWLIREGYLLEIDVEWPWSELHLGSYRTGQIELIECWKPR